MADEYDLPRNNLVVAVQFQDLKLDFLKKTAPEDCLIAHMVAVHLTDHAQAPRNEVIFLPSEVPKAFRERGSCIIIEFNQFGNGFVVIQITVKNPDIDIDRLRGKKLEHIDEQQKVEFVAVLEHRMELRHQSPANNGRV